MSARNLKEGKSKSKPKPALAVVENSGGISDEDDSVERESILKSPPKGGKRLSSVVRRLQLLLNLSHLLIYCRPLLMWLKNHVPALIRVARRRASLVVTSYPVGPNPLSRFSSISITMNCLHGRQRQILESVRSQFGTGDLETRIPLSLLKAHSIYSW